MWVTYVNSIIYQGYLFEKLLNTTCIKYKLLVSVPPFN